MRALELCESLGGRPGLHVPNSPYGLCGRKATLNLNLIKQYLGEGDSIIAVSSEYNAFTAASK